MQNSVKRFTTVKTAEICRVSVHTILRWRETDVFSEYTRMPDGYMFPGTATVSRITKVKNGQERALTLIEIAEMNRVEI